MNENIEGVLNVGDIVRLNSGGPLMTVLKIDRSDLDVVKVEAAWHQEDGGPIASHVFRLETLSLIERKS